MTEQRTRDAAIEESEASRSPKTTSRSAHAHLSTVVAAAAQLAAATANNASRVWAVLVSTFACCMRVANPSARLWMGNACVLQCPEAHRKVLQGMGRQPAEL